MGLDLWFREDVARILASTFEAMSNAQAASSGNADYQQGFEDALRAVGLAFGVAAPHNAQPRIIEGELSSGQVGWNGRRQR